MPSASITAATAGMAPPVERPIAARGQAFRMRLLSAAILLPLAVANVWLGTVYWAGLVLLFGLVMAWEWDGMCAPGERAGGRRVLGVGPAGFLSILAVAFAIIEVALGRYGVGLFVLCLGALLAAVAGFIDRRARGLWQGVGTLYVGLPSIAIIWVRAQHDSGLTVLVWMLALVIAVDTGAYAAGRLIGGPKLAPRISPNKTWAGLGGGILAAMLVGWAAALWLGLPSQLPFIVLSGAMAIVEQGGDLAESAFKRHFGVKDSSRLIPGHGGFLDRVDGLLAVSVAVALTELFGGGILAWTR